MNTKTEPFGRNVERAIARYSRASRKWNADCNLRRIGAPDAKRRKLAENSLKAGAALVGMLKQYMLEHGVETRYKR